MTDSFVQSVLLFFATFGDKLPDEIWRIFHRWYHRVEMEKCNTEKLDYGI